MQIRDDKEVQKLVQALKNGDSFAFDRLFFLFGGRIYGFVFGYLKVKEEAEEVVQEVFLTIWKTRKMLKPELSFKAYIFKIAYHLILEHFEMISKQQEYKHHLIEEAIEFTNDMDERLNYQMLLDRVEKIIEQLPPRQKEILIKKRKEGLSVKDIAHQLSISPKTVENHITEALKNIKKELGEEHIATILFMLFGKNSFNFIK